MKDSDIKKGLDKTIDGIAKLYHDVSTGIESDWGKLDNVANLVEKIGTSNNYSDIVTFPTAFRKVGFRQKPPVPYKDIDPKDINFGGAKTHGSLGAWESREHYFGGYKLAGILKSVRSGNEEVPVYTCEIFKPLGSGILDAPPKLLSGQKYDINVVKKSLQDAITLAEELKRTNEHITKKSDSTLHHFNKLTLKMENMANAAPNNIDQKDVGMFYEVSKIVMLLPNVSITTYRSITQFVFESLGDFLRIVETIRRYT
jgi:hypothetical protein